MLSHCRCVSFAVLLLSLVMGCARQQPHDDGARGSDAHSSKTTDGAAEKVTLFLNWFPEAEHGGYFTALAEGYYAAEGLEVTIQPGGPDSPVIQQVGRQASTFGIVNADNILFGRAQEAPVVALMAPLQKSPRCLIVHQKAGIHDFDDLHDLTLAVSPGAAFAAFLKKKLPLKNVQIVPYSGSVAQFLVNPQYAQQGYIFSEPYVAVKRGGHPVALMLADLGFNPYTSLLFTSEPVLTQRPGTVRKMVRASIRGWVRYLESADSANKLIHERNPEMDLEILQYGAEAINPLVMDGLASPADIGRMTHARWQQLAYQLIEIERLAPDKVDVDRAFTLEFLRDGQ